TLFQPVPSCPHCMRDSRESIEAVLKRRILILDGAMGTMIQGYRLSEADFRGTRCAAHPRDLRGNNDIRTLARPDVVREIREQYVAAGGDVTETNPSNATSIAQADYGLQHAVRELNREAAR